jgi:hypothetical protein
MTTRSRPSSTSPTDWLARGVRWALLLIPWIAFILVIVLGRSAPSAPPLSPLTLVVSDGWKTGGGDNPAWASPSFDDSAWETVNVDELFGGPAHHGFSWSRRVVVIPENRLGPTRRPFLAFQVGEFYEGCYQVFVNGEEIARSGNFPPDGGVARTPATVYPIPERLIPADGKLSVAIRLWKNPDRAGLRKRMTAALSPLARQCAIGPLPVMRAALELEHREMLWGEVDRFILAFLFLLASHYYFQMYLARRESPEYGWFSAACLNFAINTFANSNWSYEFLPPLLANMARVSSRQFAQVFCIQFLYIFLRRPIDRWSRGLQALNLVWGLTVLVRPNLAFSPVDKWVFLLILPLLGYMLWTLAEETRRGNPETRPLIIGIALVLFLEAFELARIFGLIQIPLVSRWILATLVVSMTVAVSTRFNRVYDGLDELNQELEAKVAERNEELGRANEQLAGTVKQLENARAIMVRKNEELDRRIAEINGKNHELIETQRQADRIFSALALALPGTVLDGKYRLDEKIGEGGFGVVFKATHLSLGRTIAVKVFKPRPGNDNAEAVERFKREGISISRLSHPNIITVLDSGISAQGIAYLVMELLKGVSLAQELRTTPATTLKHCLERVIPVCGALAEAHRLGIIHRDIKPDNIFINYTLEGEVIKVVDFGIAKMMADDTGEDLETLTGTNNLIGTPAYMAPERLASKPYDGGSDVYSLGVVLYELLAGRPPFEKTLSGLVGMMLKHINDKPTPLRELNPLIPPVIEDIVARTLEKNPAKRPTAQELGDLLSDALKTLPETALNQLFDRLSPMEAFVTTRYSEN